MLDIEPIFVIPTNRLRDVGETVEAYDEHFRRNGHAVAMIVCDDSSVVNQQKYYSSLEKTRTHNPLYYVGPQEKEQFLAYLFDRLRDRKLNLAGAQPVPTQLRRQSQLHLDVYARSLDDQLRRRHAPVRLGGR